MINDSNSLDPRSNADHGVQPFGKECRLEIKVANIDAIFDGCKSSTSPVTSDGHSKHFSVTDPDGHELRFFEDLQS